MLSGGTDNLYRLALASSHRPYLKVEVWRADGSERLISDLTYFRGSVTATLVNRVTRTAEFEVPDSLYPHNPDDPLNPYSSEIRAWRGIEFADGNRYSWPVFRGRIVQATISSAGFAGIRCADRAADIESSRFETVHNSNTGVTVLEEFKHLVTDALPDAQFGPSDSFKVTLPQLTWENNRSDALDEMATAVGAFWYVLADGRFVIRKVPWTVPRDPVVELADGPGGTLLEWSASRNREEVFNSITVIGERTDATSPSSYTARDHNPSSPTRVDGPFGTRNKLVRLRTPANQGVAKSAADDYLRRTTAFTESWQFNCVPDAALELGDVVVLHAGTRSNVIQVVESLSVPMTVDASMSVTCRSQVVGLPEE